MSSSAWASSYYADLTVSCGSTGDGKIYASTASTKSPIYQSEDMTVSGQKDNQSSAPTFTFYIYAKAEPGSEFTGWTAGGDVTVKDASSASTTATMKGANPAAKGTVTANFEKKQLPSFSVTYLAPQNGSYTVDGTSVGSGGLVNGPYTEAYTPNLVATAADGYAFNGWYTTTDGGVTKTPLSQESPYTASFIEATTVGADFVPCVKVTTAEKLINALANDYCIEIPAGVTITLDSNATLTSGKTLIVNGELYLSGTFTNNGSITGGGAIITLKKLVTQGCASGDTPFETTCVVASYNKKYYKTSIDTMNGAISGNTPGCTVQNGARVVRNGAIVAQCGWPTDVTPAVLCCTVDPNKAVNCITGFLDPCYDADAAKGMATMKKNGQQTKQMLVLLATKTLNNSACSSAGLLVKIGNYNKLQGNFGTMDLAGSTLTMSPSYIDNYTHTLLNGELSVTTLMYSGTLNCINLSSLSLTKLKEDYASVVNIYDCTLGTTKVPKAYNGKTENKNKVNFYSSGDNTYSTSSNFHTQNPTSVYKIYGGIWNGNPGNDYNGAGNDYGFYPTSEGASTYSLQLKTDKTVVKFDDGTEFDSLDAAFAALSTMTASSAKMTMVKNATLAKAATIPVGKTVEMELDGCAITAANGFVINNGTFLIGDRRGNIAADGGRVITSSGNFLVNNGTAEITYGYYTGDVVLNGGELTTHYGRFTGNFTAATGVDKTEVANFRGGYFDKDVSSFLRAGYFRMSGYVGPFPKPVVSMSWVTSNGGYWKVNAKLLSDADSKIYTTSSTTKESYSLDDWKRRGEIISMVTPYLNKSIDVAVGFDRAIAKDKVYAVVTEPGIVGTNEMTKNVEAGGLYRVLSEQLANPTSPYLQPSSQKSYSTALTSEETPVLKVMEFGIYSAKSSKEDNGTTANLRIDLCSGASGTDISKLKSDYALMSEYVVFGAGKTNQAMIQPKSGKATFYATIADAVAACEEGGTIKLCNNIETDTITISKAVTIDTNGMEFKGTFKPGDGYKMTSEETVLAIEKYLGKKHCTYTFEQNAIPFTLPGVENATVTADPESPVLLNTEVTVTVTPNTGCFFVDGSSSKSFEVPITTAGQQVEIPDGVDIRIKKAYVPTDPENEITIELPTGGDAPVKVTEDVITKMKTLKVISSATPTAAEVSAGLNTTQTNGRTVWQNIVMGVDGIKETNEFATIGEKGKDEKGNEIIVVKTPIDAFAPNGDMNVTVTYTLLKKDANDTEWETAQEGLSIPAVDIVPSKLEVGDVLWKFEAVFKTSGGE